MSAVSGEPRTRGGVRRRPTSGAPASGRLGGFGRYLWRRWNEGEPLASPPLADWAPALRRGRLIGLALIALAFLGFCAWSLYQVKRFALTADFAWYQQAAYLFGHGHLSPHDTDGLIAIRGYGVLQGKPVPVWVNGGEFFVVPLGIIYRLFPHVVVLKWTQDLALCGAQAIAFMWICDVVAARRRADSSNSGLWLIVLGFVLLVANPWFLWSSSFDIHSETFAAPFVLGAARDLHRGRRTAWAWGICAVLCSAVGATYLFAVAVGAVITRRKSLRLGLGLALLGLVWTGMLEVLGLLSVADPGLYQSILTGGAGAKYAQRYVHGEWQAITGKGSITYSALIKAALRRPWDVFTALWVNHSNLWANVSAAGLLGLIWMPILIPSLAVLGQGGFFQGASLPGFQNILVGGLVPVGTVAVCSMLASRLGRRRRWVFRLVVVVLALNTIVWGAIWFPKVGKQWANVSPQAVAALKKVQSKIGANDEVVASQGIAGAFAARKWAYSVGGMRTPIQVEAPRKVWFVIAPFDGTETLDSTGALMLVKGLSQHAGMHMVVDSGGIWAFEWVPPPGLREFVFTGPTGPNRSGVPAWALTGASGSVASGKSPSQSYATSNGKPGYVIDRAFWRVPAGRYRVSTRVSASALTNVEVWDATTNTLLRRVVVTNTHGIEELNLTARLNHTVGQPSIGGSALWSIFPLATPGDDLELRVWTAGPAGSASVYAANMKAIS
jgi:Predicted membrane protein (DUF2079)